MKLKEKRLKQKLNISIMEKDKATIFNYKEHREQLNKRLAEDKLTREQQSTEFQREIKEGVFDRLFKD
jgi:hypothetical protein